MGTPQRSSNAQRTVSALCNVLVWGLVLWWYTAELPRWVGFIREAGLAPAPELQRLLTLHPYAGWLLGGLLLLFSFLLSAGKGPRFFANVQMFSALVAMLGIGWVMWGIYLSVRGVMALPSIF